MKPQSVIRSLTDGLTISGHPIFRAGTHPENLLRGHASVLTYTVVRELERQSLLADVAVGTAVEALRAASHDQRHYGDNRPGYVFSDGTPTTPTAKFDYWDLFQYGITGDDGFEGFIGRTSLDSRLSIGAVSGFIALLLIDSAIDDLDRGDWITGSAALLRAATAVDFMIEPNLLKAARRKAQEDFSRRGGARRHAEKEPFKDEILAEWATGRFESQAACVRWVAQQPHLDVVDETVKRWIRKFDAARSSTKKRI
jgi:hypothetical protein